MEQRESNLVNCPRGVEHGNSLLDSYKRDLSQFLEHFRVDTEVNTIILTSQMRKVGLGIRKVSLVPQLEG